MGSLRIFVASLEVLRQDCPPALASCSPSPLLSLSLSCARINDVLTNISSGWAVASILGRSPEKRLEQVRRIRPPGRNASAAATNFPTRSVVAVNHSVARRRRKEDGKKAEKTREIRGKFFAKIASLRQPARFWKLGTGNWTKRAFLPESTSFATRAA